jgi:hypothetical protein
MDININHHNKMYVRTQTKLPQYLLYLTKFGFSRQIFIEVGNIKFQGNLYSGIHADICGQTGKHEAHWRFLRPCLRAEKPDVISEGVLQDKTLVARVSVRC